jgi:cysteine desulfurase
MDNHSTTTLDPRVLEAMLPYFTTDFGNAASKTHSFGWRAEEAVEKARAQVASLIGARTTEIIFTSGATESINLALKGVAASRRESPCHIVTCVAEHKATLDSCRHLECHGVRVTYLPVNRHGFLTAEEVGEALGSDTALISILHANNEIGTIQPVFEIGKIAAEAGVPLHVDAAQACGRISVNVVRDNISMMSLSAHKLCGPKGIGALYVRRRTPRVRVEPQIHGGGQESGFRAGTANVPAIVGFGAACEIALAEMDDEAKRLAELRDRLLARLRTTIDGIHVNGSMDRRLPNNLNVSFEHVEGDSLIMSMRDVAVSSGSACTSASAEPSHVLRAIGVSNELAQSSIRFGLGRFNTIEEVDHVAHRVAEAVKQLRGMMPDGPQAGSHITPGDAG